MRDWRKYFIPDRTFWDVVKSGTRYTKVRPYLTSVIHNSPLHWWLVALWPRRGTLSVLVGVHQFLWHPWTVARAWRFLYGRWPKWHQWVAIFCHDLGYWGKPDMDGPQGQTHPVAGANLACDIVYYLGLLIYRKKYDAALMAESTRELCLWHSTHYAQAQGGEVSELYLPDKVCVLFDPPKFYLWRANLSGELQEYVWRQNDIRRQAGLPEFTAPEQWLEWYRSRMEHKAFEHSNRPITTSPARPGEKAA